MTRQAEIEEVIAVQKDNVGMAVQEVVNAVNAVNADVQSGTIYVDPFVDPGILRLEQYVRELMIAVIRHHDAMVDLEQLRRQG